VSACTPTAGYPVHAVKTYRLWRNPHGAAFLSWRGACGATGTISGHELGTAGAARKRELCRTCFPAGHRTDHPDPVQYTVGGAP
jgi:hypothetical protein